MSSLNQYLLPIVAILSILFFVRLVFKALFLIWLFQLKEYRFDRLFAHFRQTREGRRFFWSKREFALWLLFVTPFFYRFPYVLETYLVLVVLVFGYEAKVFIEEVRKKQLRRPTFTKKAILITVLTLFTVLTLTAPFSSIALMFVDRFLIFPIAFFVFVLGIVTSAAKTVFVILAKRKLLNMKDIIVIGVTGSYGKSSTKELIADFLSEKYNVLKTPGSVNTDLGIALFVLKNLKPAHEVFVVEIGAYKKGEIASVCKIVRPTISVLTGINEQHLSLFGSIENTKKAKFELIESLSSDALPAGRQGMAFFNGDDPIASEMAKLSKVKSTYMYTQKQLPTGIKIQSKHKPFLSNLAAAYVVGQKLGLNEDSLKSNVVRALDTLGIKVVKKDDVTVLDDSFNSNPKGFHAALDVLATYKGRKVLITPGIIELGGEAKRIHRELGEQIGAICDVVILTNDNFVKPIREGLRKTAFDVTNTLVLKRENIVGIVKNQIHGKTTILLEGRVPTDVKNFLKLEMGNS